MKVVHSHAHHTAPLRHKAQRYFTWRNFVAALAGPAVALADDDLYPNDRTGGPTWMKALIVRVIVMRLPNLSLRPHAVDLPAALSTTVNSRTP